MTVLTRLSLSQTHTYKQGRQKEKKKEVEKREAVNQKGTSDYSFFCFFYLFPARGSAVQKNQNEMSVIFLVTGSSIFTV